MKHLKRFDNINEEIGPSKEMVENGFMKFLEDFISHLDNPIMMSMFYRMMDSGQFVKNGVEVYKLSQEDKKKLKKLMPVFDSLVNNIADIKKIIDDEYKKEQEKFFKNWEKEQK